MQFVDTLFKKYAINKYTRYYHLFYILFVIFILFCSYFASDFLTPLIIAIFFAYGLNAIVSMLEQKGFPSFIAILLPLAGFLTIITFFFFLSYLNIENFVNNKLPFYETKFFGLLETVKLKFEHNQELIANITEIIKDIIKEGKTYLVSLLKETTGVLSNFFLFILYLLFFLAGIKNFKIKTNRAFGSNKAKKINQINQRIVSQIQNYILYKTIINISLALSVYIISVIYGLDLAILFASLTFILNYIPIIGSSIASFFPILLAILQFSSLWYIASFAMLIILLQIIFGNIIEPKVFSKSLALSSFVVFVSLIFWSWLWGITGAFLSTPIMASIGIICDNIPSLRPINRFLQNAFPLTEDKEKLSIIYHIIHADKKISSNEKMLISRELKKDIYNQLEVQKLWKQIQKKPLSIKEIFSDKIEEDKVMLYYIAYKSAYSDTISKTISKHTEKILKKIQTINSFHPITINNIHNAVHVKFKQNIITNTNTQTNTETKEREIATSYKLLGKKYFDAQNNDKAKNNYLLALRFYLLIEDERNIFECNKYLSILNAF